MSSRGGEALSVLVLASCAHSTSALLKDSVALASDDCEKGPGNFFVVILPHEVKNLLHRVNAGVHSASFNLNICWLEGGRHVQ